MIQLIRYLSVPLDCVFWTLGESNPVACPPSGIASRVMASFPPDVSQEDREKIASEVMAIVSRSHSTRAIHWFVRVAVEDSLPVGGRPGDEQVLRIATVPMPPGDGATPRTIVFQCETLVVTNAPGGQA